MSENEDKEENEKEKIENFVKIIHSRRVSSWEDKGQESVPMWLISFTDVIALMLTFFVLLYAMSDTDPMSFDRKMGITTQAFGEYSGPSNSAGNQEGTNINREKYEAGEDLNYLRAVLDEVLKKHDAMKFTTISQRKGELLLRFKDKNFEAPLFNFLSELAPLLNNLNNRVTLMSQKAANFEQLQNLGRYMRDHGYKKPMVVAVTGDISLIGDGLTLIIQPHTGNRVE